METTTNYKLPQWVKADQIKMDDFNGAFGKIDTALKANADAAAGAASAERVTALEQKWERGKVCRVAWGSYTGTGTYGKDHPTTLSCDFTPVMLAVYNRDSNNITPVFAFREMTEFGYSSSGGINAITWGERGVSWYVTSGNTMSTNYQMNASGKAYHYLIIGYAAEDEAAE